MRIFSSGMKYRLLFSLDSGSNALSPLFLLHRRYWEDAADETALPKIDGELDNRPGKGRFERLTSDDYSYHSVTVSSSNRFLSLRSDMFAPS